MNREAPGPTAAPEQALERMRSDLDHVDQRLLEALRDRLDCCRRIARHKRRHGVDMMQPARIGVVHDRAERFGRQHDLDPAFLHRLYDVIIDETCRVEDLIIDEPASR